MDFECFCEEKFLDEESFKIHLEEEHNVHTFEGGDFLGTIRKIMGHVNKTYH